MCSSWIANLFQNNVGARSIQRHISSAKGFFNYLKKSGLVTESPFELINSPKSPSHLPNILSPEEVSQLLNFKPKNAQEKRDLAIIELIYSSGLRVSETVNTNLKDFEDNKNFLRVLGKGSKTRLVPVGRYAQSAINDWIIEREEFSTKDDALFINLRGSRITTRSVQERLKNIDIELENWRSLKTNYAKMESELSDRKNKLITELSDNQKNTERIATSKGKNLQNLENTKKRNEEIEDELLAAEKKI